MTRDTLLSLFALLVAIALCVGVWYAIGFIETAQADYAGLVARAQDLANKGQSLAKLKTLLSDTKNDRAAVNAMIPVDVITIVDSIDNAAKDAGIPIQISNASTVNTAKKNPTSSSVEFSIQSSGTFAQVARLSELLATLPSPSIVESVDLNHDTGAQWHLTQRIRVFIITQS